MVSPGRSSSDGGVNHKVVVDPEHVHTAVLYKDTHTHTRAERN